MTKSDGSNIIHYYYDYENRLIQFLDGGSQTDYVYDADGIRVWSNTDGTITDYLVDKNRDYAQVLEERDGSGSLTVDYVYGDDLISQQRGGGDYFYHYDGQMSTRQLTDATEGVANEYIYDAFGIILDQAGVVENNYMYTGEQYDPNAGFYYLRARYYDQTEGRFMTTDPFEGNDTEPSTLHRYTYANNDPIMLIDPSGEFSVVSLTASTEILSTILKIRAPVYAKVVIFKLYVGGKRVNAGYNDFNMTLRRNGVKVPGYSFIVGRDTVNGETPYVGRSKISQSLYSAKPKVMGNKQSNIWRAGNITIHSGRDTHRWITEGCVRMEATDFKQLFNYLEKNPEVRRRPDDPEWFANVYIIAQSIETEPDPEKRVPLKGNQQ